MSTDRNFDGRQSLLRRTAKSGVEQTESSFGVPGDEVGGGSEGEVWVGAEAVDREGGVVDGG